MLDAKPPGTATPSSSSRTSSSCSLGRERLDAGTGRTTDHRERLRARCAGGAGGGRTLDGLVRWLARPLPRRYLFAAVALLGFAAPASTPTAAQAPPTTHPRRPPTTEPGFHLEDGSPELDQLLKLIDQAKARRRQLDAQVAELNTKIREIEKEVDRGRSARRGHPGPGARAAAAARRDAPAGGRGQGGAAQAGGRRLHQRAERVEPLRRPAAPRPRRARAGVVERLRDGRPRRAVEGAQPPPGAEPGGGAPARPSSRRRATRRCAGATRSWPAGGCSTPTAGR